MTTEERLALINGNSILGEPPHYSDAMWLVDQLRRAREALRELLDDTYKYDALADVHVRRIARRGLWEETP